MGLKHFLHVNSPLLATVIIVIRSLTVAAPAQAQFGFPSPSLQIMANQVGNEAFVRSVIAPPAEEDDPPGSAANGQAVPPVDNAALGFAPDKRARRRNLAQMLAHTREQSPENADQMARLFATTDIFAAFDRALAPTGLRIDNVADAYAVYWITAWEAAHGITGSQTSRAQAQGVKAQVSRALLSTPDFINATSAQKQEMAEAMLVQAALISASTEAAANDSQRAAVGNAVRQGAKAMGLDLDEMVLSETGFAPAGRR